MSISTRLVDNSTEGLSIRRKILLSAATLIATVLLFSVPYPLSLETAWAIPVCVSTIFSLWLALTSRVFAAFAIACLAGILYAFYLQAFEVRYLYQFPLKDGRMFQSGAYHAYRSLFRDAQWVSLMPAAVAAVFAAVLNVMTVTGRLHHPVRASADAFSTRFLKGLLASAIVGALLGLFVGWFRFHFGFTVGIQGMLSGLALGLIGGRFLGRGSPDGWTWRHRELLLTTGLASFLFFQLIGIGLSQQSFAPHRWLVGLLSGDLREYVLGYTRYRWHTYLFRPGPIGWTLFNLLDLVFLVFFTLITIFNRVVNSSAESAKDEG
jgi:uncharacterized membrane protein